jgi:phosphotransferase system IIA component
MFDIFSKKVNLVAPVSGKVIAIENVPDAVFAQKTVGDGAAIDEISGDVICAPADGTVELLGTCGKKTYQDHRLRPASKRSFK